MSLLVIKAGILDTIQDRGRYGFQHQGINPNGPMDPLSMQLANILAGNDPGEAVIEIHFPAPVLKFKQAAIIALAGADFSATINNKPVPLLHTIIVQKNDELSFRRPVSGAWVYLAAGGGFDLKSLMGSFSTNLKAAMGGLSGRKLQKGDQLFFRKPFHDPSGNKKHFSILPWKLDAGFLNSDSPPGEIHVLPGNEWDRLTPEAKQVFLSASFLLDSRSDRMGYHLENIPLSVSWSGEMISSGVTSGTIQLLPDGKLIVLMADHQTTGGYPRIAHVISAHIPKLAQRKAGERIRFSLTSAANAEELYTNQQQHLLQLRNACNLKLSDLMNTSNHDH